MMKEYEEALKSLGINIIAGVDEAGRGPVAGPVVAAAVILKDNFKYQYINDSKKMTVTQRKKAYDDLIENSYVGIGVVSEKEIDQINILNATKKAMILAIENLNLKPEHVLIDAVKLETKIPNTSIIKGDQKSLSIAAASVIAKVTRDKIMQEYDSKYLGYGFSKHKGYLTKLHIEKINEYGPCEIHRKTFEPIKSYNK